jgi:hypothetical protein
MKHRNLSQEKIVQFYVREVPVSKLGRDTFCPSKFSWLSSVPPEKCREKTMFFSTFLLIHYSGAYKNLTPQTMS